MECLQEWLTVNFSCPTCRNKCNAISSIKLSQETINPIIDIIII
jgi:hypothetical protein